MGDGAASGASGDDDMMAKSGGGSGDGDSGGMSENGDSGGVSSGDGGSIIDVVMNPVPDADAAEDGSRIVNVYRTTEGGLKAHEGFYDTVLETRCSFQRGESGEEYCMPVADVYSPYWSDAGCTQPLIGVVCSDPTVPKVAAVLTLSSDSSCTQGSYNTYYNVGNQITPTAVYQGSSESCLDVTASALTIYRFYEAASIINVSDVVEGSITIGN